MRGPERVASLTAISPPSVDGTPVDADARARVDAFKQDARAFSKAQSALAPKAPRDMLWATLIEAGHKQRIEAARGAIAALDEWRPGDALGRLAMARRVIDGERDPLVGGEVAARAAEAMACARETIPGVGYMPHLEDPERVAEVVRAVIGESGAG
jgi:pimeloyl-ACP methyl ester carboxylesterase